MICKLCQKDKKLVKSHIVPEWIFRNLYPDPKNRNGSLMIVKLKGGAIKRPIGIYDKNILCRKCDNEIGVYDNYGKKIFFDSQLKKHPNTDLAYFINNTDVSLVKLFFISILWRASISTREEFLKINLGNFEEKFRKTILNKKDLHEIDVIFGKFNSEKYHLITEKNILLPYKTEISGINFYIIYLPKGLKCWIKVDNNPILESLSRVSLNNCKKILILNIGNYEESKEFNFLKRVANKIPNPYATKAH